VGHAVSVLTAVSREPCKEHLVLPWLYDLVEERYWPLWQWLWGPINTQGQLP